jgi:hypothetical protein
MDCPSCALVNPPQALKCDCGYDFGAGKPAEFPGWETSLVWGQKVAAFWSISWPGLLGSIAFVTMVVGGFSVRLQDNLSTISIGGQLAFYAIQALLTRRLVQNDYRSFRIYVVRDDGSKSRNLSIPEAVLIWLWILWPQVALQLFFSTLLWLLGAKLPSESVGSLSTMAQWLRFLVIGPYAVGLAIRQTYPAFRLSAHGFRPS